MSWLPQNICVRKHWQNGNGRRWVLTCNGYLNRVEHFRLEPFCNTIETENFNSEHIADILEDSDGTVWIGGNGGMQFLDQKRWIPFELQPGTTVTGLCLDGGNTLWAGTAQGLWNIENRQAKKITDRPIKCLVAGPGGNIWAGTAKGLIRISRSQNGKLETAYALDGFTVNCLYIDVEENLWIGTGNSGLFQLRDAPFSTYTRESGLPGAVLSLYYEPGGGKVWAGTANDGLYYLDLQKNPRQFIKHLPDLPLLSAGINAITGDSNGNLWIGTDGNGLFRIQNRNVTRFTVKNTPNLLSDVIWALHVHSETGALRMGTPKGLNCLYNKKMYAYTAPSHLSDNRVIGLYRGVDGQLAVATFNGLNVFPAGPVPRAEPLRLFKGCQVSGFFQDFLISPGTLGEKIPGPSWVVTSGNRLNRLGRNNIHYCTITHPPGITMISAVLDDGRGYFWLNTSKGILRVNRAELEKFLETAGACESDPKIFRAFGLQDGLKSLECSFMVGHSAIRTPDGRLWFATKKGVSVIKPSGLTPTQSHLHAVIMEVTSGKDAIKPDGVIPTEYRGKNVRFKFTAPSFIAPRQIQFKYKLRGFDQHWHIIGPGQERVAVYNLSKLEPGEYHFVVSAASYGNRWGDSREAKFSFHIERGFWDYYIEGLIITFAALILFLIVWIIRHRRRIHKPKHESTAPGPILSEFQNETIKKLLYLLEVDKIYRDEHLSVKTAAEKLSIQPYLLSQLVNKHLDKTFPDLVNGYRIGEVKTRLKDARDKRATILEIAVDAGFSSKAVFNKTFKKYTGMTPSSFRTQQGE